MKKGEKEERSIYILFKQTQRRCVTIFFTWERGERVRKSSRGWEAMEILGAGGGAPTFATSHCEIAGAHNCLIVYVIFFKEKKKNPI